MSRGAAPIEGSTRLGCILLVVLAVLALLLVVGGSAIVRSISRAQVPQDVFVGISMFGSNTIIAPGSHQAVPCTGIGPLSDFNPGAAVRLEAIDGTVLGRGTLPEGWQNLVGIRCGAGFEFDHVPTAARYRLIVGSHRVTLDDDDRVRGEGDDQPSESDPQGLPLIEYQVSFT